MMSFAVYILASSSALRFLLSTSLRSAVRHMRVFRYFSGRWKIAFKGWPAVERQRAPGIPLARVWGLADADHQPPNHCGSTTKSAEELPISSRNPGFWSIQHERLMEDGELIALFFDPRFQFG